MNRDLLDELAAEWSAVTLSILLNGTGTTGAVWILWAFLETVGGVP